MFYCQMICVTNFILFYFIKPLYIEENKLNIDMENFILIKLFLVFIKVNPYIALLCVSCGLL